MDYKAWFKEQPEEVQALIEKQFGAQYRALQKERANARQATQLLQTTGQVEMLKDFKEAKNTGEWLESRIHLYFTELADNLFGDGMITREERIGLSSAIGAGLEVFTNQVASVAPQLYERPPWKPAEDLALAAKEARSHDRTRELLHQAARERHDLEEDDYSLWVRDVYDDTFVYSHEGRLYQASYVISEENEISLGEDVEVEVAYTPLGDGDVSEADVRQSRTNGEEIELIESGQAGHYMPLIEKSVRRDGTIPIKIISPGWGSSGFYPQEVLERDATVFSEGTKMYWDHPTVSEEVERPERSLRDLAAELVGDARWEESGVEGPGVYADAKVFEGYQAAVDEMAPHIGVSINALGYGRQGEAEGQKGHIVEQLVHAKSVDFVTEPGRGGQILEMFEAARPTPRDADVGKANIETKNKIKEKAKMDELQELKESVKTLSESLQETQAENARLREAQTLRDARDLVSKALGGVEMPEMTRERLVEQIAANPPLTEAKELDAEAMATRIEKAVKREAKYLASLGTAGQISGMGDAAEGEELTEAEVIETVEADLEGAFSSMGLSESASKTAAQGR